jgi:phage-related protein
MALKPLRFHGDSQRRLQEFPPKVRSDAGYELYRVQDGEEPSDWKPMSTIGSGVREIRLRDEAGAYRVIYLANLDDAVHVLHAFQKRSQKTDRRDLDLATTRFRHLKRGQQR